MRRMLPYHFEFLGAFGVNQKILQNSDALDDLIGNFGTGVVQTNIFWFLFVYQN